MFSSRTGICCLDISARRVVNVRDAHCRRALASVASLCNKPAEIEVPENTNA
jgi:hypothetical protein